MAGASPPQQRIHSRSQRLSQFGTLANHICSLHPKLGSGCCRSHLISARLLKLKHHLAPGALCLSDWAGKLVVAVVTSGLAAEVSWRALTKQASFVLQLLVHVGTDEHEL